VLRKLAAAPEELPGRPGRSRCLPEALEKLPVNPLAGLGVILPFRLF